MMDLDWDESEVFTVPHFAPRGEGKKGLLNYLRNVRREISGLPNTKFGKAVKKQLLGQALTEIQAHKRDVIRAKGRSR